MRVFLFLRKAYRKIGDVMDRGEQFDYLPETNLRFIESNIYFFFRKVYKGMSYVLIDFMKVFEQPDAGRAMNDRNIEFDFWDSTLGEWDEFLLNFIFIKESIFISEFSSFYLYSGGVVNLVIIIELVFVKLLQKPDRAIELFEEMKEKSEDQKLKNFLEDKINLLKAG